MKPLHPLVLAPSLLAGNHAALAESAEFVEHLGLCWLHLDIMDAHFVPNLSFGPQLLKDLRHHVDLFFDTHLMLDQPHHYIDAFIDAGAQNLTIHVEPDYPIKESLEKIRSRGCGVGLALNPTTDPEQVKPYLNDVDLILAMTVQPGFGGQSFKKEVLPKIECLHAWREKGEGNYRIQVDGGIDVETAKACLDKGADTFVVGSAFFHAKDLEALLDIFKKE